MLAQSLDVRRLVLIRLNPGDDLLQGIRQGAREIGIENALIVGGVGSLNRYHVHVVDLPTLPTHDTFLRGEGAFDILSLAGAVIGGRVHAHIAFSNTQLAMGGHVEEGCRILTFAIVTLADTPEADLEGWDTVGAL